MNLGERLYQKGQAHVERRRKQADLARMQKEAEIEKDLTFKPTLVAQQPSSPTMHRSQDLVAHLENWDRQRRMKIENARLAKEAEAEKETYGDKNRSPNDHFMSAKSEMLVQQSQYKSVVRDWDSHMVHYLEKRAKGEIDPATRRNMFTPQINPSSAALVYDEPASDRLYKDAMSRVQRKEAIQQMAALTAQPSPLNLSSDSTQPSIHSFHSHSSSEDGDMTSRSGRAPRHEELYEAAQKQAWHRKQLEELAAAEHSFAPVINERSHHVPRKPLYSPRSKPKKSSSSFSSSHLQKQQEQIQGQDGLQETGEKEVSSAEAREKIDRFLQRLAESEQHRSAKKEELARSAVEALSRDCTFTPQRIAKYRPATAHPSSYPHSPRSPHHSSSSSSLLPSSNSGSGPRRRAHDDLSLSEFAFITSSPSSPQKSKSNNMSPTSMADLARMSGFEDETYAKDLGLIEEYLRQHGMLSELGYSSSTNSAGEGLSYFSSSYASSDVQTQPKHSNSSSNSSTSTSSAPAQSLSSPPPTKHSAGDDFEQLEARIQREQAERRRESLEQARSPSKSNNDASSSSTSPSHSKANAGSGREFQAQAHSEVERLLREIELSSQSTAR
jgi:hypothetical protein